MTTIQRLFIIGYPRSGTTLLRLMMNKHPRICVPPEAAFLTWLYRDFAEFSFSASAVHEFVVALSGTRKIENWKLDFTELERELSARAPINYAELCDGVYNYYIQHILRRSVDVIGDKNNTYLNEIDLLASLYPGARFIHIVRDGRAVAASCLDLASRSLASRYAPRLPGTLPEIAAHWNASIDTILRSLSALNRDRHSTVRFEDLVVNPVSELRGLCAFIEVEFNEDMLHFHQTREPEGLEPEDYMQWKSKNRMRLQPNEARRHLSLTREQREHFWELSGAHLGRFGYSRSD